MQPRLLLISLLLSSLLHLDNGSSGRSSPPFCRRFPAEYVMDQPGT
jgi:hypothetical protein